MPISTSLLPDASTKRAKRERASWLRVLFWGGFLFSTSGCDQPPEAPTPPVTVAAGGNQDHGALTSTSTATKTSTITITTTIAYKPSLIPGNSDYTLLGCYNHSESAGKAGGSIFVSGEHEADGVPAKNLTINVCLEGCALVSPKDEGKGEGKDKSKGKSLTPYDYVGLRNGSVCICGSGLSPDAHKLSNNDCTVPCSGDVRQSCGGRDKVVIYKLLSASTSSTSHASSSLATSQTRSKDSTSTPTSKTNGNGNRFQTGPNDKSGATTFPPSAAPKPVSSSTVAAITGSFSGAVLIGAGLFLCLRAQKRKKKAQELHVKSVLYRSGDDADGSGRGGGGNGAIPIITSAEDIHDVNKISSSVLVAAPGYHPHRRAGSNVKAPPSSAEEDLVPTTPALESGGRYPYLPSGLHARNKSVSASPSASAHHQHNISSFSTSTTNSASTSTSISASTLTAGGDSSRTSVEEPANRGKDRDSLYNTLLGEVRSGPARPRSHQARTQGESSAVQWRSYDPNPSHASNHSSTGPLAGTGTHRRQISSSGDHEEMHMNIASPPPSAKLDGTLGNRAWHRRKLSAKFQPPRSGPPSAPLPPPPFPASSGSGAGVVNRERGRGRGDIVNGNSRDVATGLGPSLGVGVGVGIAMTRDLDGAPPLNRALPPLPQPPRRPRRSFETVTFEPEHYAYAHDDNSYDNDFEFDHEYYRDIYDPGSGSGPFTSTSTSTSTLKPHNPPPQEPQLSSPFFLPSTTYVPPSSQHLARRPPAPLPSSLPFSSSQKKPLPLPSPRMPTAAAAAAGSIYVDSPGSPGLSMTFANTSTPSLGRYGSLSRRHQQQQSQKPRRPDSFLESPILGRFAVNTSSNSNNNHNHNVKRVVPISPRQRQKQTGMGNSGPETERGREKERDARKGQRQTPVLPPVAPGERFDHRRWRGTVYAPYTPYTPSLADDEEDEDESGHGKNGGAGGERGSGEDKGDRTPVSASSVGTSILFPLEEFDRRL